MSEFIGPNTKKVYLAHLSEQNNTSEIALNTLKKELKDKNIKFNNIEITFQNELSEVCQV